MQRWTDKVISIAYLRNAPIPVAARFKAWVCGRSLAGTAGSNPAWGTGVVSVVCCQTEVSVSGGSLVQKSSIECGVSDRDR